MTNLNQNSVNLTQPYESHLERMYQISRTLNEYIKSSSGLMKVEMQNTYNEFVKDNLFYLFRWFVKMTQIEKVTKDDEFVGVIKNIKLCHYTSFDVLETIINDKTLKFNSLPNMNDNYEGQILLKFFQNVVIGDRIKIEPYKNLLEILDKKIKNNIFSFSFTTEKDDAPQWERYTPKRKGICLITSIDKICLLPSFPNCEVTYDPIHYVQSSVDNYDSRDYDYILSCKLFDKSAADLTNNKDILNNFPSNASFIKDYTFKNEREFRLVVEFTSDLDDENYFNVKYNENSNKFILLNLEKYFQEIYRLQSSGLTSEASNFFEMLFDEVMVGPQSEIPKSTVVNLLEKNHIMKINVTESSSHLKR